MAALKKIIGSIQFGKNPYGLDCDVDDCFEDAKWRGKVADNCHIVLCGRHLTEDAVTAVLQRVGRAS